MRARQHNWPGVFKRLSAGVLLSVVMAATASAAPAAPRGVIEDLNAALLDVMQNADELGYAGRYRRLAPVLEQIFNFPFMTRAAVGQTWRELDERQRAQLIDLFTEMSIASFAARFDGYGGERFEVVGEGPAPRDAVLIETRLVRPADEPVRLDYVLRPFEDNWQIIDVLQEANFSELARQRAEFAAVLEQGGVPDLVESLEEKIAELAAEG